MLQLTRTIDSWYFKKIFCFPPRISLKHSHCPPPFISPFLYFPTAHEGEDPLWNYEGKVYVYFGTKEGISLTPSTSLIHTQSTQFTNYGQHLSKCSDKLLIIGSPFHEDQTGEIDLVGRWKYFVSLYFLLCGYHSIPSNLSIKAFVISSLETLPISFFSKDSKCIIGTSPNYKKQIE